MTGKAQIKFERLILCSTLASLSLTFLFSRQGYQYSGAELPKYFVVSAFFQRCLYDRKPPSELSIQPDSPVAVAFQEAFSQAKEILERRSQDLTPYRNNAVAFEQVQLDFQKKNVHDLRTVYNRLLSDLQELDFPLERFERFLEDEVRPSSSISSSGPGSKLFAIFREFEQVDSEQPGSKRSLSGQELEAIDRQVPETIADRFYWTGPEGNLGLKITGKFNSREKMAETLGLLGNVGFFKAKRYPFEPTLWRLADIVVSVDLNAAGDVATWRVSGPRPLLLKYLTRLHQAYGDKSIFYDFGYSFVNFQAGSRY